MLLAMDNEVNPQFHLINVYMYGVNVWLTDFPLPMYTVP